MKKTIRLNVSQKALAGALSAAMIGYACAPIAPSLEKSRFDGGGTSIPGGIPLNGNVYQTQLSGADPAQPSSNRIALETSTVQYFKSHGQVQILLGGLPPGGIRGTFVVSLPSSAIPTLQEFRTEMFETSRGSGIWLLRVKSGVHPSISQLVRDHLQRIYLDLAVENQAVDGSSVEEETGSETATESETESESEVSEEGEENTEVETDDGSTPPAAEA